MGFIEHTGIRVVVLGSLLCQVLLQLLGNRRKFSRFVLLRGIVWLSYVSADFITTYALGMISTKLACIKDLTHLDGETKLNVLWASCLLVLLGGPDSITAYSVEDNELWLRHVFGLVAQTSLTGYLCFLAWAADCPSYLSLALLMVGVVKYGERVWVLWQVSYDKMQKKAKYSNSIFRIGSSLRSFKDSGNELEEGYLFFKIFRYIFLNQKLDHRYKGTINIFNRFTDEKAFKIIEIELGFMYDLLHTKAQTTYTCWGRCRRLITSTIFFIVLAVFSGFVNKKTTTDDYPRIDVAITGVLLITNILSEIYWVCMLLSSDRADVVWVRHKSWFSELWTSNKNVVRNTLQQPRWSNSIGQLSFFTLFFFFRYRRLLKRLHLYNKVGPYCAAQHQEITDYIKSQTVIMINNVVQKQNACLPSSSREQGERSSDNKQLFLNYRELLKYVCTAIPPAYVCLDNELREEYDFADCITIWHVATEHCNQYDDDESSLPHSDERTAAILLSRYMFYLLVRHPSMLQTVNRETKLKEFREDFDRKNIAAWSEGGCRTLKDLLDRAPIEEYYCRTDETVPAQNYLQRN